jgi:hypothetical protein
MRFIQVYGVFAAEEVEIHAVIVVSKGGAMVAPPFSFSFLHLSEENYCIVVNVMWVYCGCQGRFFSDSELALVKQERACLF